jgi:hypothetical protein
MAKGPISSGMAQRLKASNGIGVARVFWGVDGRFS